MSERSGKPHDAVRACYATWAGDYFKDYYDGPNAYPPVHLDIVERLLEQHGARSIIDAGCGPASMLRSLVRKGFDACGFDLTPEMVAEARRVLKELGLTDDRIWQGDVLDPVAYRPHSQAQKYDAALCVGVAPHLPETDDETIVDLLRDAVRPGGLVLIEARNRLFALFSQNRYSREFFLNDLIDPPRDGVPRGLQSALEDLAGRFRLDLPPVRAGKTGEPGYDEVLARTHNPLLFREVCESRGLTNVKLHFYHYHCLPPMYESAFPEWFRRRSLEMEDPADWRGYFMASAFIVSGVRDD